LRASIASVEQRLLTVIAAIEHRHTSNKNSTQPSDNDSVSPTAAVQILQSKTDDDDAQNFEVRKHNDVFLRPFS